MSQMLSVSTALPTSTTSKMTNNGKIQKSMARSRRRLAALSFLSNISLDGGTNTPSTNAKSKNVEIVCTEKHNPLLASGAPSFNASTPPELETPSPLCSTGILSKFLEFDSLKHSIVTPFRERYVLFIYIHINKSFYLFIKSTTLFIIYQAASNQNKIFSSVYGT